ncbi:MAG: class I SAM-dependent methyltransferase [Elusimicrobia bacterium]|nr:class I SAM-dependent methyltransferase [Elusimicrobiota bacterium]
MTLPDCPCCGAPGRAVPEGDAGFQVPRCPGCGLGRTWPALPPDELGRWYPPSYYGRENVRFNRLFELLTRLFRWRRARRISGQVPLLGPVLDVGCGRGIMLDSLRSLGYQAHGVELNAEAAWHARHRLGLDVRTGGFQDLPEEAGRYQAVIFWHSLEHLPDPAEALARARRLLSPAGVLLLAVPNYDSWQARLFGRHWFHLDLPRHCFHFGPRSLQALLARHSFRVVRRDHFCLEQNPFGWLQSAYNALGLPKNLLYDLLKAPSARSGTARRHPLACLLALSLLPVLLPLALLLTVLDAALRQGGTVEVYAVKEPERR